jgi:hypothetical protein
VLSFITSTVTASVSDSWRIMVVFIPLLVTTTAALGLVPPAVKVVYFVGIPITLSWIILYFMLYYNDIGLCDTPYIECSSGTTVQCLRYEHIFITDRRHYKLPNLRVVKHNGWAPQRQCLPILCASHLAQSAPQSIRSPGSTHLLSQPFQQNVVFPSGHPSKKWQRLPLIKTSAADRRTWAN